MPRNDEQPVVVPQVMHPTRGFQDLTSVFEPLHNGTRTLGVATLSLGRAQCSLSLALDIQRPSDPLCHKCGE